MTGPISFAQNDLRIEPWRLAVALSVLEMAEMAVLGVFFERLSTRVRRLGWHLHMKGSSRTAASVSGPETTDILRSRSPHGFSSLRSTCAIEWPTDLGAQRGVD